MSLENFKLLIPAAGKGSRTGLKYPKSLYEVRNRPIIIDIIKKFDFLNSSTSIISSKEGKDLFRQTLDFYKINYELILQKKQNGMASAVLEYQNSKDYEKYDNIIIIWSDILNISKKTILELIKYHLERKSDISLSSRIVRNPYTVIQRENNKVLGIYENKNSTYKINLGERDIGLFIVKKKIFNLLKKNLINVKLSSEYSFIKFIDLMIKKKMKVNILKNARYKDTFSFNQMSDLKKFI